MGKTKEFVKKFTIITLLASGVGTGCKKTHLAVKETPQDLGAFWGRYTNGLPAGSRPVTRQMVHLGIPDTDKVVVWYALRQDNTNAKVRVTISDPATRAGVTGTVRHYRNKDFATGRVEVVGLKPDTAYEVKVEADRENPVVLTAHTRPLNQTQFSFLASSCFQPFQWDIQEGERSHLTQETVETLRAYRTRAQMGKHRRNSSEGPSFALSFGDQVYVDPGAEKNSPIALLYGKWSEQLRGGMTNLNPNLDMLYRSHLSLNFMDDALSALPTGMIWDDHDLRDGWGAQGDETGSSWQQYYRSAKGAYEAFQLSRNPNFNELQLESEWKDVSKSEQAPVWSMGTGPDWEKKRDKDSYFSFDWGSASFFMTDTRTSKSWGEGRTMNEAQFLAIEEWLRKNAEKRLQPHVLVFCNSVPVMGSGPRTEKARNANWFSKVPLLGHLRDDSRDRLTSLNQERLRLIRILAGHVTNNPLHRLVILSGDVHYTGVQVLKAGKNELGYEIITSGLAQSSFDKKSIVINTIAKPVEGVNLRNHGAFSGPNFAEIFVDASRPDVAPEVKLMLYTPTIYGGVARLEASNVNASNAFRPTDIPPNTVSLGQRVSGWFGFGLSDSQLLPHLQTNWNQVGQRSVRNQLGDPATRWE